MKSALVEFYSGRAADYEGRMISDILQWDHQRLEQTHNYIQWVFPLREPSSFNANVPVLTESDLNKFLHDPILQNNLKKSLQVYLNFLGLSLLQNEKRLEVTESSNFKERISNWMTPGNHNFLRITRVLKSLKLLGSPEYGEAFYKYLSDAYVNRYTKIISARTFDFWTKAVK